MPDKQFYKTFCSSIKTGVILLTAFVALLTPMTSNGAETSDQFESAGILRPSKTLTAPDFNLKNLSGDLVKLSQQKGKVVLLNFWATWCRPCIKEMPSINNLFKKFKDKGLTVIAVSVDEGNEKAVKKYVRDYALSFTVLMDRDGEARKKYEVTAFPFSYLIDREGRFIGRIIGEREWDNPEFVRIIEGLL